MFPVLQIAALIGVTSAVSIPDITERQACSYPGWSKLKYLFTFGDSYTQTGFDPTLQQPSPSNPFGNPNYPGYTSSNGPNWVGYLTTSYNRSLLQTVNLAYGGATVDADYVKPYKPEVLSFKDQVNKQFLPIYAKKPAAVPWTSSDSLFGFFFGINDVGNSWWLTNDTLYPSIFNVYSGLVDSVYQGGARNFLFVNVPPVERAPQSAANDAASKALQSQKIQEWNTRLNTLASNLKQKYPGVTIFNFDARSLFNKVLDNPASYPETSAYKDTTTFCAAYKNGTPSPYTSDPSCPYPVDQYFWLNELHPTFRVHNATARLMAQQLAPKCGANITNL